MLPSGGLFVSVSEAAQSLKTTRKTILAWCESGKLPAIPVAYGSKITYKISQTALSYVTPTHRKRQPHHMGPKYPNKTHHEHVTSWKKALSGGLLNGKPYSPETIGDYTYYINHYFRCHQYVSMEGLENELSRIPAAQYAKREHLYKAVLCLAKYLVRQQALDDSFINEAKVLKPKRHRPPKRSTITERQLENLLASCDSLQDRFIVSLLANTGLRASEACALLWSDIDLDNACMTVRLGKGGKTRRVGLSVSLIEVIREYRETCPKRQSFVLRDVKGNPMHRHGLYQRLERIGKKAGIAASPHALRRAFVTINANAGRPLQMLQRACGHSSITTTMAYCQTSEQEVIDAMKSW